jgi:hypothetical protein
MQSDDILYFSDSAADTLPLDQGLSGFSYLEQQDRKAGRLWNEDVEPVAGGSAPEPEVEQLRPYCEIPFLTNGNVQGDSDVRNELLLVLTQMFPFFSFEIGDKMPILDQLFKIVRDKSNYEITGVTRVMNRTRQSMHAHFKKCYNITNERTVFHGTSRASADSITKTGFRGAVCQRAKFGRGIYATSNGCEALAYAQPAEGDMTQTVLAVTMLQGPTTIGSQDMVDFGTDEHGNEILTTTNPEETIFCAAYGDQLLATYRITLRYLFEHKHTPAHHNLVRIYHPTIWNRIKGQTAPAVPPPVFLVPPAAGAGGAPSDTAGPVTKKRKQETVLFLYEGFKDGCNVRLNYFNYEPKLTGKTGVIQLMMQFHYGTRIYITVDNQDSFVEEINANRRVNHPTTVTVKSNWLLCLPGQLTLC